MPWQVIIQGKPCGRGHSGLRYNASKQCVECARIRYANWLARGAKHLESQAVEDAFLAEFRRYLDERWPTAYRES
jgi:hypothetical protein